MITKEKLYKQIESLPDKVNIEDLIEKLLFIDKIENRIEESDNNKAISESQSLRVFFVCGSTHSSTIMSVY